MLRKLLAFVGMGVVSSGGANAAGHYAPYPQAANQIYNLLGQHLLSGQPRSTFDPKEFPT